MTAVAHETRQPSRSLLGKLATAVAGRRSGKLTALIALAREHVVTVAALASADMGAFRFPWGLGTCFGLVAVGVSVLALDFAVRG